MQKSSLLLLTLSTLALSFFSLLALTVPQAYAQTTVTCREADINQDMKVNISDYSLFVSNFLKTVFAARTDINRDGKVDIIDYSLIVKFFTQTCTNPTPTPSPSPSASPKVTPTPTPTPSPTPTVAPSPTGSPLPPGQLSGFWITPAEIMQRPMTGDTWKAMVSRANNPGTANIADQDSKHPESTLAMALVATRTNDSALKEKAVNELIEAIGTEKNYDDDCGTSFRPLDQGGPAGARGLAMGRNMLGYVVAADILNLRANGYNPSGKGKQFEDWVKAMRVRQNCPDNGHHTWPNGNWFTLAQTHEHATSNGNALAGASRIAMAAYVGDKAEIDRAWLVFRRYAGDRSVGPDLIHNDGAQTWMHNKSAPVGINPAGAKCNNGSYPADGVVINDQGRGGGCPTDLSRAPGYTPYPWEGLQGSYAQALIYDRLNYTDGNGNDAWRVSNSALKRAVEYQWFLQDKFGGSWYVPGRADWVKHLAKYIYGYQPNNSDGDGNYNPQGGERNMDWVQWTHQ